MAAETAELKRALGGSITETVAEWLTPQYVLAARRQLDAASATERWRLLRLMASDLTALRRGDLSAERLALERERLAFDRLCGERAKEAEFWKWTKRPEIKRKLWPRKSGGLTKTMLRKIERELNLL
jgi:hypothetical protein